MILQKINQNHEELILCIDARPNWRVGLDSTYKGHRSEGRKKSLINFDEVFASLDQFLKQLEAFPLSIIEVPLAEADDIGGVLAEYFTLNKQKATLITSDHDWSQSISEYVTQWCPIKKKEIVLLGHEKGYTYLKCLDKDVLNFSIIHAIQGDKGDGVNSLTGGTQFTQVFQDHLDSLRPGITPLKFANLTQAQKDILTRNFSTFKRISSGKNKGKLAFTNIGPSFSWNRIAEPYNQKLKSIAKHVWQSGIGNRDGHVEIWMRFIDQTYGVGLLSLEDGSCAMDFNEQYARAIRGRYWGTENEFYGDKDYVKNANGPYKNQPYRFMVSSLRALQMRRNYFSIAGDSMEKMHHPTYKTQDFLRYLTKVMGKQMENTPDAFILLGERYISQDHAKNFADEACVKDSKKGVAVRSFGRWLMEESRSASALRVSMPESENYWGQNYYMPEGVDYEYSARKAKQFEFDLNDNLSKIRCKNGCKAEIKITFKDNQKTTMNVWYDDEVSQGFTTKGDNKIKTVTFNVNSRFQNDLRGKDFMINSKTDLTLIMIRVNFL